MAITIHQQPQLYTPAYNRQVFVALSTETAQSGFKYVVEIKVNGGTTFTQEFLPRVDGHVVFDTMEFAKDFIVKSFNPTTLVTLQAIGGYCSVEVKVREYYTGAFFASQTVTYTAYDAYLTDSEFETYNYTNYVSIGNTIKLLQPNDSILTSIQKPDIINDVWVRMFRGNAHKLFLSHTDAITMVTSSFAISDAPLVTDIIYFNVGYNKLLALGITPKDKDSVYVDIGNSAPATIFEINYSFKEICTKQTKYSIYYIDRYGNILFKTFEKGSYESDKMKTNLVRLGRDKLNVATHQYGFNQYDREQHTVSTNLETKLNLSTDFITQNVYASLIDMFASPCKWLFVNNKYVPVTITDTDYNYQKHENEKLFNLSVTVEFDNTNTRQRGL